ncbi:MAG TPA: bifunctional nuclease family protein [Abditibacteriaceae bacterium]
MIRMTVEGIGIDPQNNPLVLLRDEGNQTYVAIWIGAAEAVSIQMELDGRQPPRPMTHDLLAGVLKELGAELVKVTISDFDRSVFYAQLHLQTGRETVQQIDARPSDAIALALRAGCTIYVAPQVVEKTGIQIEEARDDMSNLPGRSEDITPEGDETPQPRPEELDKFRKLLEGVDIPDDDERRN